MMSDGVKSVVLRSGRRGGCLWRCAPESHTFRHVCGENERQLR